MLSEFAIAAAAAVLAPTWQKLVDWLGERAELNWPAGKALRRDIMTYVADCEREVAECADGFQNSVLALLELPQEQKARFELLLRAWRDLMGIPSPVPNADAADVSYEKDVVLQFYAPYADDPRLKDFMGAMKTAFASFGSFYRRESVSYVKGKPVNSAALLREKDRVIETLRSWERLFIQLLREAAIEHAETIGMLGVPRTRLPEPDLAQFDDAGRASAAVYSALDRLLRRMVERLS